MLVKLIRISLNWKMIHTSTWSLSQKSMLNDLTFVICVPSFRCDEAHHMQMNIPNWIVISIHYHDILSKCVHSSLPILTTVSNNPNICKDLCLPGFLAWQSAHTLFPGTVFISSWRARSLRACWRSILAWIERRSTIC